MARLTEEQLRNHLWFLLDMKWAGQTVRLSSARHEVPSGPGGADVSYYPGMEWSRAFRSDFLLGGKGNGAAVDLTLYLDEHLDVPALLADGHVLGSARGTLSIWAEGTDAVIPLIEGPIRDPAWTSREEPITGRLEVEPATDTSLIPGVNERVISPTGGATWTAYDPAIGGEYYPRVWGAPGGVNNSHAKGSPCLYVVVTALSEKGLIAGHHVHASHVRVTNYSAGAVSSVVAVTNEYDGLGQPVATIPLSIAGTGWAAAPDLGSELWIQWVDGVGAAEYGAMDENGDPMRGAGAILEWMLRRSSVAWDSSRVAALRSFLDQYLIDTYVLAERQERIPPWHWIQDVLLPILPVSTHIGAEGLYLTPWRFTATAADAVADLVEGPSGNCEAVGYVESTPRDDVASSLEVSYDYDPQTNGSLASVKLSGDPQYLADVVDSTEDAYLREAVRLYGPLRIAALTTRAVEDAGTAGLIAAWLARKHGPQRSAAVYDVDQLPGGRLQPGDVITITDAVRGWTTQPAIVHAVEWTEGRRVQIEIRLPSIRRGEAA